jgi:hypothetical protein
MAIRKRLVLRAGLITVALAATLAIGILAGREMTRPQPTSRDAPAASVASVAAPPPAAAPELLAYRVLLKIPLDLATPRGLVSMQDGMLWVCGDRSLERVDRTGAVKARITLGGEPTCVALGPGGKVIVGMSDHVEVLDPASGRIDSWADLGSQAIVTSVAYGASGVYVADAGNRMVMRFDTGGKLEGLFDKGFIVPSPYFDVAVAADGSVWVANPGTQTVRHYSPDGTLLASWGKASFETDGFAGCCNPAAIALLPCGSLVTGEKGFIRVKVYEPDGSLVSVVAQPGDFLPAEVSVRIATRQANGGEILVLVPGAKEVRVYVKKGAAANG